MPFYPEQSRISQLVSYKQPHVILYNNLPRIRYETTKADSLKENIQVINTIYLQFKL